MPVCADPNAVKVPAPETCWLCRGAGKDPVTGNLCERCQGGRYEFARFDLAPSRSFELRRVRFEPRADGVHVLWVWQVKRRAGWRVAPEWVQYTLAETGNDWGGRSFLIDKTGEKRSHNVFVGAGSSCECEARTYETTARHNQRAHDAGGKVYPGLGCVHQDVIRALLNAGWLDLATPSE